MFKRLFNIGIRKLLSFSCNFSCEQDFSVIKFMEMENRNGSEIDCLIQTKINIYPWIHELIECRKGDTTFIPLRSILLDGRDPISCLHCVLKSSRWTARIPSSVGWKKIT
jgi:hypothetical protein